MNYPKKNTDYHLFQGKCHWNHLVQPDLEFRNWNVKLYLNDESRARFMKLREREGDVEGILNDIKKDEEGYYVTFKRPMEKAFRRGTVEQLTPPTIVDKDGNPWKGEFIGHGSDITVKVERYRYNKPFNKGKGSAIRLMSVRVDNLVEYTKEQMDSTQLKDVSGLSEAPPQYF